MLAIRRDLPRAEPAAVPDRRGRRRRRPDDRLSRAHGTRVPRARCGYDQPDQRLSADRSGWHRDRALGAHGRRPGDLYRHRHPGRRGARRRLVAAPGRGRGRQPEALRQHHLGRRGPGHGRLVEHPELVGALPARRGGRARHAGRGGGAGVGRAGRRGPGREGRASAMPRASRPASASSPTGPRA